jgi:hypothetical protein
LELFDDEEDEWVVETWHGGTGIFPFYLVTCMTTFFAGKFFLTTPVRKTNERRTLSQTPTVFDRRPNTRGYRGLRNDDDRPPKTFKNIAT